MSIISAADADIGGAGCDLPLRPADGHQLLVPHDPRWHFWLRDWLRHRAANQGEYFQGLIFLLNHMQVTCGP